MPRNTYNYIIQGTAAGGQTWSCTGITAGEFGAIPEAILRDTFIRLTKGNAVFGQPGVGCSGPYDVTRLIIEKVKE